MDYNSILKSSFLFCDLQDEQIKEITDSSNIRSRSLQRGDKILFNNEGKCLVFLISGRLDVLSEKGVQGGVGLQAEVRVDAGNGPWRARADRYVVVPAHYGYVVRNGPSEAQTRFNHKRRPAVVYTEDRSSRRQRRNPFVQI